MGGARGCSVGSQQERRRSETWSGRTWGPTRRTALQRGFRESAASLEQRGSLRLIEPHISMVFCTTARTAISFFAHRVGTLGALRTPSVAAAESRVGASSSGAGAASGRLRLLGEARSSSKARQT